MERRMKLTLMGSSLTTLEYQVTIYRQTWRLSWPFTFEATLDGTLFEENPYSFGVGMNPFDLAIRWRENED